MLRKNFWVEEAKARLFKSSRSKTKRKSARARRKALRLPWVFPRFLLFSVFLATSPQISDVQRKFKQFISSPRRRERNVAFKIRSS